MNSNGSRFLGRLVQAASVAILAITISVLARPAEAADSDSCASSPGNLCLTAGTPGGIEDKYCSNTPGQGECMTCYSNPGWSCPSPYGQNPDLDGYSDWFE